MALKVKRTVSPTAAESASGVNVRPLAPTSTMCVSALARSGAARRAKESAESMVTRGEIGKRLVVKGRLS